MEEGVALRRRSLEPVFKSPSIDYDEKVIGEATACLQGWPGAGGWPTGPPLAPQLGLVPLQMIPGITLQPLAWPPQGCAAALTTLCLTVATQVVWQKQALVSDLVHVGCSSRHFLLVAMHVRENLRKNAFNSQSRMRGNQEQKNQEAKRCAVSAGPQAGDQGLAAAEEAFQPAVGREGQPFRRRASRPAVEAGGPTGAAALAPARQASLLLPPEKFPVNGSLSPGPVIGWYPVSKHANHGGTGKILQ